MKPSPKSIIPKNGTFWYAESPDGRLLPPYPCPPPFDLPIYALGNGQFLVDNSGIDYPVVNASTTTTSAMTTSASSPPPLPGGGGGGGTPPPPPDTRRNYAKFASDQFSVVDTNAAATSNPSLYSACKNFPASTNLGPNLQIKTFGKCGVLIKANHFNYSGDTRDFALLVCDNVGTHIWKNIDLLHASDTNDGWLVQGTVPNWKVTDPMWLQVTNITTWAPVFFTAIPYGGPQVQLTGLTTNATVSNTITLHTSITDLSGVTNEQFEVDVDGNRARTNYSNGTTITLDTHYNPSGPANVFLNVAGTPLAYAATNPPINAKLIFTGSASLPLTFANATYLWSAGDMASPDVGTNYIIFGLSTPVSFSATIKDPTTGTTLKSFSGSVPAGYTGVSLPFNFTTANGAPFSGNSYSVAFSAAGTSLGITNQIDREGVRTAAANILTYEQEDPALAGGSIS